MPQLRDRDKAERRLARAMRSANSRVRNMLLDNLGTPPDPRNIPASVWRDAEKQVEEETAIVLGLLFLAASDQLLDQLRHDPRVPPEALLSSDHAASLSERFGRHRAQRLAGQVTDTTRRRLQRRVEQLDRDGAGRRERDVALRREVRKRTNMKQDELVARTEVSTATTAGESVVKDRHDTFNGVYTLLAEWRHRIPWQEGHPCEKLCLPLVGTTQNMWPSIHPNNPEAWDGPPCHAGCDCHVIWHLLTPDEVENLQTVFPGGRYVDWSVVR